MIKYYLQIYVRIINISAFAGQTLPRVILLMNTNAKLILLRWIILESGIKCNLETIYGYINSVRGSAFKMRFMFDVQ